MPLADSIASIAATIADYREGAIPRPDAKHVGKWLDQFPANIRELLAAELAQVIKRSYISKAGVQKFLKGLLKNEKLAGADAAASWRGTKFLDIQGGGNSQHEMLAMLDAILQETLGFGLAGCGKKPSRFVYIDDGLFTGNRILKDLKVWLERDAPAEAEVHVIIMALHRGGQYYAKGKLLEAAKAVGKKIEFTWWRIVELEDRKANTDTSDVLRLTQVPNDANAQAYCASLKYPVALRKAGSLGEHNLFASVDGRELLEQSFMIAGARIRTICPKLGPYQRPLGNMILETPGFGSTIVTFRNCPNNAPLAFWAGQPWYPLFPRKTN